MSYNLVITQNHLKESCLMNKSIHHSEIIFNKLKEINLTQQLSYIAIKHIITIIITIFTFGYKGKTINFEKNSDNHRTTVAHFLNEGKWNSELLEDIIKCAVINIIYSESEKSGEPVFCMIDDTIASKTKPSSKALHPIEDAYFHQSHLKGRQDYGHQAVGVMLSCNGLTLNYDIILYDKSMSKIDLVCGIADELKDAPNVSYLLCDSWYTCSKVTEAFIKKGFYTVGALKTNRIIYPSGIGISISKLAENIFKDDMFFCTVTVKGHKYHVFRYECNLKNIDNAVVLITYPVGAFHNKKALRSFLCTDTNLTNEEILNIYTERWDIEVFFRDSKSKLALDKYQIRSSKGIKRFWLISSLAYLLACFESDDFDFSEGYCILMKKIENEKLANLFKCAKNCKSFDEFIGLVA